MDEALRKAVLEHSKKSGENYQVALAVIAQGDKIRGEPISRFLSALMINLKNKTKGQWVIEAQEKGGKSWIDNPMQNDAPIILRHSKWPAQSGVAICLEIDGSVIFGFRAPVTAINDSRRKKLKQALVSDLDKNGRESNWWPVWWHLKDHIQSFPKNWRNDEGLLSLYALLASGRVEQEAGLVASLLIECASAANTVLRTEEKQ